MPLAPSSGGLLTETVGWRWIFWLNVTLTMLAFVLGAAQITESRDPTAPRRIDLVGLALITTGIGLFTLTFDRAPAWGCGSRLRRSVHSSERPSCSALWCWWRNEPGTRWSTCR
jgi:MFS family permease